MKESVQEIQIKPLGEFYARTRTQGRAGEKLPRMNLGLPEEMYTYIRLESRKEGMSYSEFISAVMRWREDILQQNEDAQNYGSSSEPHTRG